ncbi:transcriptional regulator [Tenericutes bacterium MO-XQ]|jgi:putative transcriptional regulator|nr:transcriptional regulator [Tenericutes bacterium MO-XQ]
MKSFNDNTPLELKNNLKIARVEKSLTQDDLAKMSGVTRQTIGAIESGKFNPTAKLALIFCIILEKKFEELFYFDLN